MKEEKMMILTMLEQDKITSEEAIKLMEALEDVEQPWDPARASNHETQEKGYDFQEGQFPKSPIFNTLEDIGSDIGNALTSIFDGLKGGASSFGFRNNYETISSDIEYDLDFENPSLDLNTVNGGIRLKPIDGNRFKIRVSCQYKYGLFSKGESFYNFNVSGNKIVFTPKYNNNISIRLDVSLPRKHYDEILLNSTNGKIDIKELDTNSLNCITTNSSVEMIEVTAKEIDITTRNGRIDCRNTSSNTIKAYTTNSNVFLMYVSSPNIDVKSANAKIKVSNISTDRIICRTSNSSIDAHDIVCNTINLITSNGKINLSNIDINKVKEINTVTSNGSINSEIHCIDRKIYFDLGTSMGNINLDIPGLVYKVNKQVSLGLKKIVAHSSNFDEDMDHVKFIASTSNGSIKIY